MLRPLTSLSAKARKQAVLGHRSLAKRRSIRASLFGFCLMMAAGMASHAAETVHARYGSIETELLVSELQAYADTGAQSPKIAYYGALLGEEPMAQLRAALTDKIDLPVPVLARFFSTPSGYRVLEKLTDVVYAKSDNVDSVLALRTAVILAASHEDSLTFVNLLRSFPDSGVQLDLGEGLRVFGLLQSVSKTHKETIATIKQRSQGLATPLAESTRAQYSAVGPFNWKKRTFNLTDKRPVRLQSTGTSRSFPLELYIPESSESMPIVILSHGLGEGVSAYRYFAEHLASHGFVVAVPEHPGSSVSHWRALLDSQTNVIASPQEFIDRPLDIQYILDVLTEQNQSSPELKGRFDLGKVGLFGHSYGGYTALASAGAQIDFGTLHDTCAKDIIEAFNPSLLLQCQAKTLTKPLPPLSDSRIKAVLASQPIVSAVLGEKGLSPIRVPVALMSGGADLIAPLVPEQINPYGKIAANNRSLVLLEKADHYSIIGDLDPQEELIEFSGGTSNRINFKSRQALKLLGLSFFQSHLNGHDTDSFMTLVRSLNDPSFPVYGLATLDDPVAKLQD